MRQRRGQDSFERLVRLGIPIVRGGGSKPLIALTFDDGPGPATHSIIDSLKAARARATFFLVGDRLERKGALAAVRRMRKVGEVGNHTWTHSPLVGLAPDRLAYEVAKTSLELRRAVRRRVRVFRPPEGRRDADVDRVVWSLGLLQVLWNVDGRDTNDDDPQAVLDSVIRDLGPGKIVHLHDKITTAQMVLPLLEEIRERGLRPVTVSELLTEDPPLVDHVLAWAKNFWEKDPPQPLDGAMVPKRRLSIRRSSPGPVLRYASPNYRPGRNGHIPRGIVIHTSVGSFRGVIQWFADPTSGVSAHYLVAMNGRVAQFVDERDTALHAGRVKGPTATLVTDDDPNPYTIGIEFEDRGDPESGRTDELYEAGGALIGSIASRWNIPLDRDHIVGHREIFAPKSCPGSVDIDRLLGGAREVAKALQGVDLSRGLVPPSVERFRKAAWRRFPGLVNLEIRHERTVGPTGVPAEHTSIDISHVTAPTALIPVWRWAVRHARRYQIATIIFDRQIWTATTPWLHTYTGVDAHSTHIHVDFSSQTAWAELGGVGQATAAVRESSPSGD